MGRTVNVYLKSTQQPVTVRNLNTRCVCDVTALGAFSARVGSLRIGDDDGNVYEYSGMGDVAVKCQGRMLVKIYGNNNVEWLIA